MSEEHDAPDRDTGSFVQRWSRRKLEQREPVNTTPQPTVTAHAPELSPHDKEIELPPIDALHEDSEVGMFFSEGISENLKRQALRKLFHFGKFNVCDGLDDYAEDYTFFEPLTALSKARQHLKGISEKLGKDTPAPDQNPTLAAIEQAPPQTVSLSTEEDSGNDGNSREE